MIETPRGFKLVLKSNYEVKKGEGCKANS